MLTALGDIIFYRIDSAGSLSEWNRYSTSSTAAELHAGDFNGDGVLDLVTSDTYVFYGTAPGHFQPPILLSNAARSGGSAVVADFNHDGISDLVYVSDDAEQLPAYRFGSVAGLGPAIALSFTAFGYQLAVGDYNGDGALDIVGTNTYSTGARAFVAVGDGSGSFSDPIGFANVLAGKCAAVGYFNGDSRLDVASPDGSGSNAVNVSLHRPDSRFVDSVLFGVGAKPQRLQAGRFHAAGRPRFDDLLAANVDDGFTVMINTTPAPSQ